MLDFYQKSWWEFQNQNDANIAMMFIWSCYTNLVSVFYYFFAKLICNGNQPNILQRVLYKEGRW